MSDVLLFLVGVALIIWGAANWHWFARDDSNYSIDSYRILGNILNGMIGMIAGSMMVGFAVT